MTIVIISLEPLDTRYTGEWFTSVPDSLRQLTNEQVIQINGTTNSGKPTHGAFLDFLSTNQWKNEQINQLFSMTRDGVIGKGDKILFTDAWNPTILEARYVSDLLGLEWQLHGIWHAGNYDPADFLGRINDPRGWANKTERSIYASLDYSWFATDFHMQLFADKICAGKINKQFMWKSGQPHDKLVDTLSKFPKQTKIRQIVFPHRLAPEKQLEIFKDLEKSIPDANFIVCQEQPLTKHEYHSIMAESMICFSASLQETMGISVCIESPLLQTIPLCPDRLSYSEVFEGYDAFKYPSEWAESFDAYLRNKDFLIEKIRNLLDNYDDYKNTLETYVNTRLPNYTRATAMFKKLVETK